MKPHAHFPDLPIEGNAASSVQVISFEDLQCNDCAAWRRLLDGELLHRFGADVAFISRDFPLPRHSWAELAAMISRRLAVHDAQAAVDFRRYCFTHIADINLENLPDRAAEFFRARDLRPSDAVLAMGNDDLRMAVQADYAEGMRLGVRHTPTVIIGERRFEETFTAQAVEEAIREALDARH